MLAEHFKGELNAFSRFKDKELEQEFRVDNIKGELSFLKWVALISGIFYLFFIIHDYYYIPEYHKLLFTAVLRLIYFLWSVIYFLLCIRMKNYQFLDRLTFFTELLFVYTQIQILYVLKYQNFDSHSLMILIIFIGLAVVSSDWIYFVVSDIFYTIIYFWTSSMYLKNYSLKEYLTAVVYFLVAIVLCSVASYRSCRHRRLVFYQNILSEHIRQVEEERSRLLELEKKNTIALLQQEQIISKVNKMAFLRSQIKPHFIYNALNTIEQLCYEKPEAAGRLILDLSNYLAYCFDFDRNEQTVPFERELELIHAYVEIEKARFSDWFRMEYEICITLPFYLPPLILQPLIENSIKHGVGRKGRQDVIKLIVSEEGEHYYLCVEDDGIGIPEGKAERLFVEDNPSAGIGLSNINSRLSEMYGEKLTLKTKEGEGTRIFFHIPRVAGVKHEDNFS